MNIPMITRLPKLNWMEFSGAIVTRRTIEPVTDPTTNAVSAKIFDELVALGTRYDACISATIAAQRATAIASYEADVAVRVSGLAASKVATARLPADAASTVAVLALYEEQNHAAPNMADYPFNGSAEDIAVFDAYSPAVGGATFTALEIALLASMAKAEAWLIATRA